MDIVLYWPFFGVLALVSLSFFVIRVIARGREETESTKATAVHIVNDLAPTFARRRAQLVYVDPYGVERSEKWEKEKSYIAFSVIKPTLYSKGHLESAVESLPTSFIYGLIEKAADSANGADVSDISGIETGIQYEQFCARILQEAGWSARVTVSTGDQGTDIVAERDGRRVVVQCKFYSKPVGNKAVQEAAAARLHERADLAVVVSNAAYTPAVRQLAGTTGVILLHHDDLARLSIFDKN